MNQPIKKAIKYLSDKTLSYLPYSKRAGSYDRIEHYERVGRISLSANETSPINIIVNDTKDFLLTDMIFYTTGACDIQLIDGASDKNIFDEFVPVILFNGFIGGAAVGDGQGYFLKRPYQFERRSVIKILVRDTSGLDNNIIALLRGGRVYTSGVN